jgi:hypothetical protein
VQVGKRFWSEVVLGATSAVLALLTLVWPNWIEDVFGVEPDGGNGAFEWSIVALLALSTIVLSVMARSEWRRASAVGSHQEIE